MAPSSATRGKARATVATAFSGSQPVCSPRPSGATNTSASGGMQGGGLSEPAAPPSPPLVSPAMPPAPSPPEPLDPPIPVPPAPGSPPAPLVPAAPSPPLPAPPVAPPPLPPPASPDPPFEPLASWNCSPLQAVTTPKNSALAADSAYTVRRSAFRRRSESMWKIAHRRITGHLPIGVSPGLSERYPSLRVIRPPTVG